MADRDWFSVETHNGEVLDRDAKGFPNKESALDFARTVAPSWEQELLIVKYSRREVRTLRRKVTIEEADVTAAVVTPA